MTDTGFDFSVLSEFRSRVAQHGLEAVALDLLIAALVDKGLIKPRGKARTDSTHVLAAVRDLNRLELAGEAVRAALEALVAAAAEWVRQALDVPGWADRYGLRVDSWRLPISKTKRAQLAAAYGADGFTLLGAVYAADSPSWLAELPAVEALRRILVQNYVIMVDRQGREVITIGTPRHTVSRPVDAGSPPRTTWMPATAASGTWPGTATSCTSARLATPSPPIMTMMLMCPPGHRT